MVVEQRGRKPVQRLEYTAGMRYIYLGHLSCFRDCEIRSPPLYPRQHVRQKWEISFGYHNGIQHTQEWATSVMKECGYLDREFEGLFAVGSGFGSELLALRLYSDSEIIGPNATRRQGETRFKFCRKKVLKDCDPFVPQQNSTGPNH